MLLFTKRNGWWELRDILSKQQEFKNSSGTFRGRPWNESAVPYVGYMDESERLILRADIENHGLQYMVWSYNKPIAWLRTDGYWRVTSRNYSKTTAQHLSKLRTAISSLVSQAA